MSSINKAFNEIDRVDFVPATLTGRAHLDIPLRIGYGQTISQPSTVKRMFEWLDPKPGDKIMDVGSGSGWTTALLSNIVGPKGMVYAVEIIPELLKFGEINCQKFDLKNVKFFPANMNVVGLPNHIPFDRILVSAAAQNLPKELIGQLKKGGKLIIPIQNDILEITKITDNEFTTVTHSGYIFVPLV